ncbi:kinase domain protein [Dictyocaulus viviparus]|uniref:Kinase domain protein n=1 Tax=Dictyocaulus viviparus TaxID=29172 RepID=A0A0D8XWT8_DICVI|nr:kinase domain protein [Dictyocaulus viviparus]
MLLGRCGFHNVLKMVTLCDVSMHGYVIQQWVAHCFDGMGDVFLGRCNDSTRVAVKRIPHDALDVTFDSTRAHSSEENTRTLVHSKSPDRGQLLREDIGFMKLLRHSHIVDLQACFVFGPSIYLVLGACSYGSISDVISSSYQCGLPEKAIASILRQLLSALTYLHSQLIIHRSVRASHLLLDSAGTIRLTGFRLARKLTIDERYTTDFDSHLETSLLWLAPEVLGQDLNGYSTKADIYSVGATLCEIANGFPPFGDMERLEMLYEKSRGTTPRLLDSSTLPSYEEPSEHRNRTFTGSFHNITGLCLRANPVNRPDANSLFSHSFLKKARRSLLGLLPLAQTLDQMERVSGREEITAEKKDVPEWVF